MVEIHSAALPRVLLDIAKAEVLYEDGLGEKCDLVRCTIAAAFVGYGKDRPSAWAKAAYDAMLAFSGPSTPFQYIEDIVATRKKVNAK